MLHDFLANVIGVRMCSQNWLCCTNQSHTTHCFWVFIVFGDRNTCDCLKYLFGSRRKNNCAETLRLYIPIFGSKWCNCVARLVGKSQYNKQPHQLQMCITVHSSNCRLLDFLRPIHKGCSQWVDLHPQQNVAQIQRLSFWEIKTFEINLFCGSRFFDRHLLLYHIPD